MNSTLFSASRQALLSILTVGLFALSGFAASSTVNQAADSSQDGATGSRSNGVIIALPAKFELGDIEPGSEHSRTFVLRNVSNVPVRITAVTPTCRCTTTTDVSGSVIPPNEELAFTSVLAAPTTPGNKNAKVQISFAGQVKPLLVEIEGDITMAIKAAPPYVGGAKGDEEAGTVLVESIDGKPFSILSSGGRTPVFIGFNPTTDPPRSKYRLSWNLTQITDLPRRVWWVIFTDHAKCPVLPLRIRNSATGSRADMERYTRHWRFDESIINAEHVQTGATVTLELVLKHYNPRARGAIQQPQWGEIRSMTSLSGDLDVTYISSSALSGEEVKILFSVSPGSGVTGPLYDLIEVETVTGKGTFGLLALIGSDPEG